MTENDMDTDQMLKVNAIAPTIDLLVPNNLENGPPCIECASIVNGNSHILFGNVPRLHTFRCVVGEHHD
jgi:hypothetical protein